MIVNIIVVGLVAYAVYYILVYPRFLSPYRHLPLAKQPALHERILYDPSSFDLIEFAKVRNDGLVRYFGFLNQERLLLTTPDACKDILYRNSYSFDKLPSITALQAPVGVSGLVTAKGDFHKRQRRDTIAAYNVHRSAAQYPSVWKTAREAAEVLSARLQGSATNKIYANSFFLEFCMDAIGRAAFSFDFNALQHPEQNLIKQYLVIFSAAENTPLYIKLMQLLPASWHPAGVRLVAGLLGLDLSPVRNKVHETVKDTMKRAEQLESKHGKEDQEDDRTDILGGLVQRAPQMTEKYILDHAMTILAGSVEMIANQLSWGFYALAQPQYQHIQAKLRAEVAAQFPQLPDTFSALDMSKVPHVMNTVNEIIRFYPSVADRGRWCNSDAVLIGQTIKKGTFLTWPVWSLNHSKELWGDDADEFRPERWSADRLDGFGDEELKKEAYSFMTFGQGTRKCPGEHYTRIAMGCVLIHLLDKFEFKLPTDMLDLFDRTGCDAIENGIIMKAKIFVEVERLQK